MPKLFSTLRILSRLFMARTFGEYIHTVWNGTFRYAEYKWRGKTYYFPTEVRQ